MVTNFSSDSMFDGDLICYQHLDGYRFSIDPILLAHFTPLKKNSQILDIGTGCGVISLILAYRYKTLIKQIEGLELQQSLFDLAKKNVSANNLEDVIKITKGDLKNINLLFSAEKFDNVFCNPPYFTLGTGRTNTHDENTVARHQIAANMEEVVKACSWCVKNRGVVSMVYPADQLVELLASLSNNKLTTKRIQTIYNYPESQGDASLVLIEATKNGGVGCKILPPFFVYSEKNGDYSEQMKALYKRDVGD